MKIVILLFFLVLMAFCFISIVWATLMQRKGIKGQKIALDGQAIAIERQKKAMKQIEESMAVSREQLECQKQIISLLHEIRDEIGR
jgi:hypothetical protein